MSLRLHLISWNVHAVPVAPRIVPRLRAVASQVTAREPDVVLFQELWRPQDADQLVARMPGYDRVDPPVGGSFGRKGGLLVGVRRASGWRIAASGFHTYSRSGPAWKLWEGDGLSGKGVLHLTLERRGQRIVVANTHLQAAYRPGGYREVRESQLGELQDTLAQVPSGTPVLLAGDLNVTPDESILAPIVAGYVDLSAPLRARCRCGTSVKSGAWIDYVFARSDPDWSFRAEVQRIESTAVDHPYSDHHGLDARIDLAPTAESHRQAALRILAAPSTRRAWLAAGTQLLLHGVV